MMAFLSLSSPASCTSPSIATTTGRSSRPRRTPLPTGLAWAEGRGVTSTWRGAEDGWETLITLLLFTTSSCRSLPR